MRKKLAREIENIALSKYGGATSQVAGTNLKHHAMPHSQNDT